LRFLKWELPAYLWSAILLFLTWWPKIEIPDIGIDFKDKIAHLLAFGLFGFLVARARSKEEINQPLHAVKLTMLYCSLFAVFDEVMQGVIPGRDADIGDGLANIAGVILGVIFFRFVWNPRSKKPA
jgi:VanZ family protein